MNMKSRMQSNWRYLVFVCCFFFVAKNTKAQTDQDAIMMSKNNFCSGIMYQNSKWNQYWEGTLKRDNQNIGTVTANSYSVMGNYGVSRKLNLLFGLPYIQTKASAGTLHSMKGMQDMSLWIKWMPFEKKLGAGTLSLYGIGGLSFPTSNYVADFLPLSVGLKSTNLSLRAMADYQIGSMFATLSGTYILRSNVKIDRNSYYTDQLILSNEVSMPDATSFNLRLGYRSALGIAEFVINNFTTQGGFDITRNNMPFISNRMNATAVGLSLKYNVSAVSGLSLIAGANTTIAGRNMGQTTAVNAGAFYIIDFSRKTKKHSTDAKLSNK
jgi:hypothetical protein